MTTPLTPEYLAEVEARLKAATTPGPWSEPYLRALLRYGHKCEIYYEDENGSETHLHPDDTDASLIANAPTDIAHLLAEVRRLTEELKICKHINQRWADDWKVEMLEVARLQRVEEAARRLATVLDNSDDKESHEVWTARMMLMHTFLSVSEETSNIPTDPEGATHE